MQVHWAHGNQGRPQSRQLSASLPVLGSGGGHYRYCHHRNRPPAWCGLEWPRSPLLELRLFVRLSRPLMSAQLHVLSIMAKQTMMAAINSNGSSMADSMADSLTLFDSLWLSLWLNVDTITAVHCSHRSIADSAEHSHRQTPERTQPALTGSHPCSPTPPFFAIFEKRHSTQPNRAIQSHTDTYRHIQSHSQMAADQCLHRFPALVWRSVPIKLAVVDHCRGRWHQEVRSSKY